MISAWYRLDKRLRLLGATTFLILAIIVVGYFNLAYGRPSFTLGQTLDALFGAATDDNELAKFLVLETRLPRVLVAIIAGLALGLSGYLMQGSLRNPLADPGLLGIAQASTFIVAVAAIYPELIPPSFPRPLLSLGAGLVAGIIVLIAANNMRSTIRLILAGVVISGLFFVLTTTIIYTAPLNRTASGGLAGYLRYVAGSLVGTYWERFNALWPWIVPALPLVWFSARAVNLLQLGDELASGAGLNPGRARLLLLLLALLLVAPVIAIVGPIGFVALFAPHISRFILANTGARSVMILSGISGAFLVVAADVLGRLVLFPIEIPAGVWTVVVITPIALYLLSQQLRRVRG